MNLLTASVICSYLYHFLAKFMAVMCWTSRARSKDVESFKFGSATVMGGHERVVCAMTSCLVQSSQVNGLLPFP